MGWVRHDSVAHPAPMLLQTARVSSAELFHVQDASVPQIDQQCAGMPDRCVACGCMIGWRFHRGPASGFSDEIRGAPERIQAGRRRTSISRVRLHPATPSCDGDPCRISASIRRRLSCQGPPSRPERAGERGTLVRVCPHGYFYAPPKRRWITSSRESVFRREVVGALRAEGAAALVE